MLSVRRQGACLRCRILKIQCSLENPCQPCLQSAVKGSERKVLSFCYCVRTRFADVNIFAPAPSSSSASSLGEAADVMQTETLMRTMSDLLARIATPANFLLTSNPAAFNNTMVSWLTDPGFHLPNGSLVGLCCSSLLGLQFQEDAAAGTDGLITDFRRFLLATSLAHAGWRDGGNATRTRDLCAAGHISGCRLISRLDRILTPQFLARCGRESCQVLFLLVLGAVLGVGYSSSQLEDHSPEFPSAELLSPEFQRSPTLWLAMKEHLCQMLAHHLIFVGSMLGIKLETGVEQRIIDTAVARWNKAEQFVWADAVDFGGSSNPPLTMPGPAGLSSPGAVKREDEGSACGEIGELKSPPWHRPKLLPHPPPLVAIPCPEEVNCFQPRTTENWSENPQSYLSMFDEPDSLSAREPARSPSPATQEPRSMPATTTPESQPRGQGDRSTPSPLVSGGGQGLRHTTYTHPASAPEYVMGRERKRRSIWVVRPFDSGPESGLINVHSRLRGGMGMESLRAFV